MHSFQVGTNVSFAESAVLKAALYAGTLFRPQNSALRLAGCMQRNSVPAYKAERE
jgi:hypothetical protein